MLIFISYLIRINIEELFIPYLIPNESKHFAIATFKIIAILPQSLIILVACLLSVFKEVFNKELVYNATKLAESNRELELIKAKINPHFLLNSLNNIYAINYQESPKTSEAIMQLSKVLSFTIYRSKDKLITIQEEVELLESLIGLYQLKHDNNLNIDLKTNSGIKNSEAKIPSLLLFSLLENAFKHSDVSLNEEAYIMINLKVEDKFLYFDIENSISTNSNKNENQMSGGLGSNAINQLLVNQYSDKCKFEIIKNERSYKVILVINEL